MWYVGNYAVSLAQNVTEFASFMHQRLWHDNGYHWRLPSQRYHFWKNIDRWFHRPTNRTKPLFILDGVATHESLQVAFRPKYWHYLVYIPIGQKWDWKFASKISDFLESSSEYYLIMNAAFQNGSWCCEYYA